MNEITELSKKVKSKRDIPGVMDFPTQEQHAKAWETLARNIAAIAPLITAENNNTDELEKPIGELTIIGSGIETLGFRLGDEGLIQEADAVFYCVADPATVVWIKQLRPDAYDLYVLYHDNKPRYTTYMQMTEAMLYYVRQGKRVVAIYYGHPGIFVLSTHRAILIARREGHRAQMKAAVSALDCLCADLGVDPSYPGMQTFEATDMLIRDRKPDIHLHVVLWQVGLIGEMGYRRQGYLNQHFSIFIDYLQQQYGQDYLVTHYIASRYPTIPPVIKIYSLQELHNPVLRKEITGISTFYLPPKQAAAVNKTMLEQLALLKPGQTLRKSVVENPLREMGLYTRREMQAFKDFSTFKVPYSYHWQENTAASRFIIELQQDSQLREHYLAAPKVAVSTANFPDLSKAESDLLAKRDMGLMQVAAKGVFKRSSINEDFLTSLFTTRSLTLSFLQVLQQQPPKISTQEVTENLNSWAQRQGFGGLTWSDLYKDRDRMQSFSLLPWSGIYFRDYRGNAEGQALWPGYLFILRGSTKYPQQASLNINGNDIEHYELNQGILRFQTSELLFTKGMLNYSVNTKRQRCLLASFWGIIDASSSNPNQRLNFVAPEVDIAQVGAVCKKVGNYYIQGNESLKIDTAIHPERGKHIQVKLNDVPLEGPIRLKQNILSVGSQTFSLASAGTSANDQWTFNQSSTAWAQGKYQVKIQKQNAQEPTTIQSINLDQNGLNIDGYPMQALQTNSSGRTFSWSGESHQYSNGKLSFFLDPVSLLPCVAGAWQDHSGEQTICHGMIPPDANSPHKREPLFDSDWWDVLLKYSLNTDKDGPFLWYHWSKTRFAHSVLEALFRKLGM